MKKYKIHIDPQSLDKSTTDKYKNWNKVDRNLNKFYTIQGIRHLYRRNRILFVALFILWLVTFAWLVTDLF